MYRMLAAAALGRRAGVAAPRGERRPGALRFATIAVDQRSGGAGWQPDVWPVLERVTGFHWRMENAGRDELVPPASARGVATASWRDEFGDEKLPDVICSSYVGHWASPGSRFSLLRYAGIST